jgi:hypothetical protein
VEVKIATWSLWAPDVSEFIGKRRVIVLAEMTDDDCQGEIGLLLHSMVKEKYVWNIDYFYLGIKYDLSRYVGATLTRDRQW